jgi:hypothetical protein
VRDCVRSIVCLRSSFPILLSLTFTLLFVSALSQGGNVRVQEAMYEELVRLPDVIKSIEARLQRAQARWIPTKLDICDAPLVCDFPCLGKDTGR